jgi:hypothetical protein
MSKPNNNNVIKASLWMLLVSVLLFWLPVIGPLLAGIVGGQKAGNVGSAIIAVFLPAIVLAIGIFILTTVLSGLPLMGLAAGVSGFIWSGINVGPLLLGALIGAVLA